MNVADDRTYIRVHDGMDEHPKIVGLSDGAFRLLMRSWAYCSRQLTDGRIPEAAWKDRGSAKSRRELVDAGLAHLPSEQCSHPGCPTPPPRHVQMHDYLEHQRSADEVAELKRKRAEAGSKGGKSRANAQASAKQVLRQTGSKTVASTEAETEELRTTSRGKLTKVDASDPDTPPRCPRHAHLPRFEEPPCKACEHLRVAWEATHSTADQVFDRPPWCGHCDEWTRQVETERGMARCPSCHPLVSA